METYSTLRNLNKLGRCSVCRYTGTNVKHLEIYPFGSEGVDICLDCELAICEFITKRSAWALELRKHEYMMRKQIRNKFPIEDEWGNNLEEDLFTGR